MCILSHSNFCYVLEWMWRVLIAWTVWCSCRGWPAVRKPCLWNTLMEASSSANGSPRGASGSPPLSSDTAAMVEVLSVRLWVRACVRTCVRACVHEQPTEFAILLNGMLAGWLSGLVGTRPRRVVMFSPSLSVSQQLVLHDPRICMYVCCSCSHYRFCRCCYHLNSSPPLYVACFWMFLL